MSHIYWSNKCHNTTTKQRMMDHVSWLQNITATSFIEHTKHSHEPPTCMLHTRANHVTILTMQLLTRQCATASNNTMHMCLMPKPQPTDSKLMSPHPEQNQQQVMYHCVVNPNNYIIHGAHNNIHMGPNKPACGTHTHTSFELCFTQCNHCNFNSQS